MLGRSIGITDDQLRHLLDDTPPAGVYTEADAVLIRYTRILAAGEPIDDDLYHDLREHFSEQQVIALCLLVGAQTSVTFFNKTFLADIDDTFTRANEQADRAAGGPPINYPPLEH